MNEQDKSIHRRSFRSPVRNVSIFAIGRLVVATVCLQFALPAIGAEPPAGYSSTTAVKLAIVTGRLKLIDVGIELPETVDVRRGVEYGKGGDVPLKLDLYSPKAKNDPKPALIFVHGGGWKSGRRDDYRYYGIKFAQRGFVVASISYRLRNVAPFPAAVEDAKCAVRWIRANAAMLNVDPERIAIVGGSAGGYLAMMVGYSSDVPELEGHGGNAGVSSCVQAVVNLYGPTDLTTAYAREHDLVKRFLGKSYEEAPKLYERASPLQHVSADDPPTLILHGTLDELVPISQADALAAKIKQHGVACEFHRLTGWPHTMDLAQTVNGFCRERMLVFFEKHLVRAK